MLDAASSIECQAVDPTDDPSFIVNVVVNSNQKAQVVGSLSKINSSYLFPSLIQYFSRVKSLEGFSELATAASI